MSITAKLSIQSARARFTFASVVADNTLSIDGHTFTAKASGASGDQFNLGADDEAAAANAAAAINASATSGVAGIMVATSDGAVLSVTKTGGPIALASSGSTIEVAWIVNDSQAFDVLATFVQSGGSDTDPISKAISSLPRASPAYQDIAVLQGTVIKASATTVKSFPCVLFASENNHKYSLGGAYTTDGTTSTNFTAANAYVSLNLGSPS